MKIRVGSRLVLAVVFAAAVSACAPRKTLKKTAEAPAAPAAPAPTTGEANIRGTEFTDVPELQPVHFDYDAYALRDEARETLKKNAEYLKDHTDLDVLVTGNCDERGTTEYNLALGQKRAKEVREYYIRLGLPAKSIATISYGKERPLCTDSNESCWHQNRRAETKVRARTAASAEGQ